MCQQVLLFTVQGSVGQTAAPPPFLTPPQLKPQGRCIRRGPSMGPLQIWEWGQPKNAACSPMMSWEMEGKKGTNQNKNKCSSLRCQHKLKNIITKDTVKVRQKDENRTFKKLEDNLLHNTGFSLSLEIGVTEPSLIPSTDFKEEELHYKQLQ